jgi:hypothetical protein
VGTDAMDGFDQQVYQAVGERTATQVREGCKRRQPKRIGMPAQFVRGLDRHALAIAFDLVRPCMTKKMGGQPELPHQIELGQLGLQAVDARPARIGTHVHQHRRNVTVRIVARRKLRICCSRAERGIEPSSCRWQQSTMDFVAEALVVGAKRGPNDAFDPISGRRLDLQCPALLFERTGQLGDISAVGNCMIAEPFRKRLAIGDSRLAEAEQGADFGAVALCRPIRQLDRAK